MNEIHIIISEVSEENRNDLLKQLEHTIQNYEPRPKITVSEPALWRPAAEGVHCKGNRGKACGAPCG